jgi:hypothetical protein
VSRWNPEYSEEGFSGQGRSRRTSAGAPVAEGRHASDTAYAPPDRVGNGRPPAARSLRSSLTHNWRVSGSGFGDEAPLGRALGEGFSGAGATAYYADAAHGTAYGGASMRCSPGAATYAADASEMLDDVRADLAGAAARPLGKQTSYGTLALEEQVRTRPLQSDFARERGLTSSMQMSDSASSPVLKVQSALEQRTGSQAEPSAC